MERRGLLRGLRRRQHLLRARGRLPEGRLRRRRPGRRPQLPRHAAARRARAVHGAGRRRGGLRGAGVQARGRSGEEQGHPGEHGARVSGRGQGGDQGARGGAVRAGPGPGPGVCAVPGRRGAAGADVLLGPRRLARARGRRPRVRLLPACRDEGSAGACGDMAGRISGCSNFRLAAARSCWSTCRRGSSGTRSLASQRCCKSRGRVKGVQFSMYRRHAQQFSSVQFSSTDGVALSSSVTARLTAFLR